MEKLTIFCKIPPPPPQTVADPPSCKPGRQARRRETWAKRRKNPSQHPSHTSPTTKEACVTAELVAEAATSPQTEPPPSLHAEPLPALSLPSAPPLRKSAKTYSKQPAPAAKPRYLQRSGKFRKWTAASRRRKHTTDDDHAFFSWNTSPRLHTFPAGDASSGCTPVGSSAAIRSYTATSSCHHSSPDGDAFSGCTFVSGHAACRFGPSSAPNVSQTTCPSRTCTLWRMSS
jgi:hypothetical protein